MINLLKNQQKGFVWADEMISVGYKRSFYESQQQELIKVLNAYRDNFNILGACIPNFFSLDKDLRDIFYFHFHIVERGIAILHTPLKSRLYTQDKWDVLNNSKIENKWSQRIMKDPNFANKLPYHNLSTFRGILYFNKMTIKQEILYKAIKREKRKQSFGEKDEKKELPFINTLYDSLIKGKLTMDGLSQICFVRKEKLPSIQNRLNIMLKTNRVGKTLKDFLNSDSKQHKEVKKEIDSLIPSID